ncbi:MAG TPA: DUF4384 domain-containing protein, partial [Rhizobacter sp.]
LQQLAARGGGVRVAFGKPRYAEGDAMTVELRSAAAGYLHVLSVGPDGVPLVLLPNGQHRAQRVAAGAALTLPTPAMSIGFSAGRPFGATLVAAIVTREPVDLHALADGEHDDEGRLRDVVGRLSQAGVLKLRAAAAQAAGSAVVRVCPPAGACR